MQPNWRCTMGKASPSSPYSGVMHLDDNCVPLGTYGIPIGDPFGSSAVPGGTQENLWNRFECQPMETCPRNFIIFDQTDSRSRVMYNPALAQKLSHPSFGTNTHPLGEDIEGVLGKFNDKTCELLSSLKEDSNEIDALLSSEDDYEEEVEDDLISTARTPVFHSSSCAKDGSSYHKPKRACSTARSSSSSCASSLDKKRERMKKMVGALKGIIPGGEQMDTPAILDKAVKYLKSLKVEAEKLGIRNL